MKITKQISLNVDGDPIYEFVTAKQGDKGTRCIAVSLYTSGEDEFSIPADAVAFANIKKPNGQYCYNECEIVGNRIMVELTNQALSNAGTAKCDVDLRNADQSEILSSVSFAIEIEPSMRDESAIMASNEFTVFDGYKQSLIDATEAASEATETLISSMPNIGENGNWHLGETDTGVPSRGDPLTFADLTPAQKEELRGEKGDVLYATFEIDLSTGELYVNYPDGYNGATFELVNGELEVIV